MFIGLGTVDEFALNGPWVPFTDINIGPFQNKQAYFDSTGVEYLVGSGPMPLLGSGGSLTNFVDPFTGNVNLGSSSIPPTSSAAIVPVASNPISDLINSLPGGSTISSIIEGSIFGIPNWILLVGVTGFFVFSEVNKGKR